MGGHGNDLQVAEAPGVEKKNNAEIEKQLGTLEVDQSRTGEPLRECVRSAMASYFDQLDGHTASGLHRMVLGEVEVPLLESVLSYTGGNQTQAAEVLGINRATLRKKLKEYNLG